MQHQKLLMYYGQAMRLVMMWTKLLDDDPSQEGLYLSKTDEQLERASWVRDAHSKGLLDDLDLITETEGDCRDLESIAKQRLTK